MTPGCIPCAIRIARRSLWFKWAREAGQITPGYAQMLQELFPGMELGEAHKRVKGVGE